jgi:hypothetical protein
MEMHDLHVSVLHAGAFQLSLFHVVQLSLLSCSINKLIFICIFNFISLKFLSDTRKEKLLPLLSFT